MNYTGNGVNTIFAFTFKIFAETDLCVYVGGVLKTLNVDYTIGGEMPLSGGNITFVVAPAAGDLIIIVRILPLTQLTDYTEGDSFPAETHEAALDRLVMIAQQINEKIGAVGPGSGGSSSGINYIYTQGGASTTWVITHNLGHKEVLIQVFDTNYNQIIPLSIVLDSTTQCTVTFSVAQAGYAIISSGVSGQQGPQGPQGPPGGDLPWVNAKIDSGAKGDGSTNDSVALQGWITSSQYKGGVLPIGTYLHSTGLTITQPHTRLFSLSPVYGDTPDNGSVLKYTGTGTGILIGISPSITGDFIYGIELDHLRIRAAVNTAVALDVWYPAFSKFHDLTIVGNSGSNIGMRITTGVETILDKIDIQGGFGGVPENYLQYGLVISSGLGGSPSTTLRVKDSWIHYCLTGARIIGSYAYFENSTFESNTVGLEISYNSGNQIELNGCWFEANLTHDIEISTGGTLIMNGGLINSIARQTFMYAQNSLLVFNGVTFVSTHANPILFEAADMSSARVIFIGCTFPANCTLGGSNLTNVTFIGGNLKSTSRNSFSVPTYADNTAALAGGLFAKDIYKTATGTLMIVY